MSLASRRKLLLHNAQGGGTDEPKMISVLTVDTDVLPFPYDNEKKYAFQIRIGSNWQVAISPNPMYIYKTSWRDYRIIATSTSDTYKTMIPLENVDTSELGNGEYYISKYNHDYSNIGVCNYPVQEVRYSDGGTKLIVVRE